MSAASSAAGGGSALSLVGQTNIATAASELARNALVYGGGGEMRWQATEKSGRAGLTLIFEDHGPGIPDLAAALTDGWSSGRSLGMGLPGSRRLVEEFDVQTFSEGTRVTISSWR